MRKPLVFVIHITAISIMLWGLGSCVSNPDSSGLEYMPDMYRTPSIEPYVDYGEIRGRENMKYKMSLSALTPPSHTVPYYGGKKDSLDVSFMLPYVRKANISFRETHGLFGFDFSLADEYALSINDKNPLVLTNKNSSEMLAKGKSLYTAMCQHCHGEKGDGNGPMVLSGAYTAGVIPAYTDRLSVSDGQMFYSIYYGKGMMGAHNSLVSKKEIWTLVHYVRQFQNADYGKFDENGNPKAIVKVDSTAVKTK
jgi:mono/diheme cytochrome c family protein